jgi:hypothetical protein
MLTRVERYAALTVPKVCLPDNFDEVNTDETHDYQSIGAQAVNHLANKLMLAMFAPSRPFLKLQPGPVAAKKLAALNMTETQLNNILAKGERDAIKALDKKAQRPTLFRIMRHLIVAGNVLLSREKRGMRAYGLKNYVVKRNIWGKVQQLVIRENIKFDELEPSVRKLFGRLYQDDSKVNFYKWIVLGPNGYTMTQWVDERQLPKEWNGRWPEDRLPYSAITWDLADESDYGTGLVEEYIGDLEAISVISESVVDGGVLGTEMRWLVNPSGTTSVTDLNNSKNGDALPGLASDVAATQGGNPLAIQTASEILDRYERRVSRGFLMGSAVIRDAERVTQEEVRMTAQELETAYGGVYSSLAASLQYPVAQWLFDEIDLPVKQSGLEITIITGLDALSRNGDLDNFRLAMEDMARVTNVPPEVAGRIKWEEVASFIGQGRNIDLARFIMTDAEYAQVQQAQAEARVAEQVVTDTGSAMGAAAAQGQA